MAFCFFPMCSWVLGGTTSPLYRGTDCAEGTCTVPCCAACTHGDTDTAHRHTQAAPDTTVQQDGIATSLTGSKAARDSELAANAVLQKELDSLRVKLLSEQERNVKVSPCDPCSFYRC